MSGHDFLLVSGSLHYFTFNLPEFLSRLEGKPRHVLINRTPLVNAPEAATVQSVHGVTVACRLLNRRDLIAGMESQGYELRDFWTAPEFSIRLPLDPDYWVRAYSGLYFRARD
jgi:putative methyltransferase (TIGR04325 family)